MGYYQEPGDRVRCTLPTLPKPVSIKLDCFNLTDCTIAFPVQGETKTLECGDAPIQIGMANELINSSLSINGNAENIGRDTIEIAIITLVDGQEQCRYNFPNDYAGTPDYDENDSNPSFEVPINFIS